MKAYKATPRSSGPEIKFYDADKDERMGVLKEVGCADIKIVYVCVDKHDPSDPSERGNELYCVVLEELMKNAMSIAPTKDLRIVVDESWFIEKERLKKMAENISKETHRNVKSCEKGSSDKCVRIADYVVGAIRTKYENDDAEFFEIIREKISSPVNR